MVVFNVVDDNSGDDNSVDGEGGHKKLAFRRLIGIRVLINGQVEAVKDKDSVGVMLLLENIVYYTNYMNTWLCLVYCCKR